MCYLYKLRDIRFLCLLSCERWNSLLLSNHMLCDVVPLIIKLLPHGFPHRLFSGAQGRALYTSVV
jgi:hypothetical protein